jgi:hypothetical protein
MRSSPARAPCQNAKERLASVACGRRARTRDKMQLRLNSGLTNAVKVRRWLRGSAGRPPKSLRDYRGETEEKDQRYTGGLPEVHRRYIGTTPKHLPTTSLACPMHNAPSKLRTRDSLQIAGRWEQPYTATGARTFLSAATLGCLSVPPARLFASNAAADRNVRALGLAAASRCAPCRFQPVQRACICCFPLPCFRRMFRRSKVRLQAVGFAG